MTWPLVRYVLTAAIRDRLIISIMVALLVSVSLSIFIGTSAITEKDRFALVFAGAGIRIAGVLGLILFTVFFIRRSFEARDVEFVLSRPVSRVEFLLSYSVGLSILAIILTIAQAFSLYILAPHLFNEGHVAWIASIAIENIIIANTALFFSMVLSSAASAAMASAGFYVLGRMMGQLLGIVEAHEAKGSVFKILEYIMQGISAIMPRLDLIGQSSWLVYEMKFTPDLVLILGQGIIFAFFIIMASLIDLVRRQF